MLSCSQILVASSSFKQPHHCHMPIRVRCLCRNTIHPRGNLIYVIRTYASMNPPRQSPRVPLKNGMIMSSRASMWTPMVTSGTPTPAP
ncbi:hypothetical protein WJX84_008255 [Apatococcus fuscideae]|uniref:Uncharacterized protein n=1 Tax=Apatococcus fuscideae TaxID=2026836 RepID=A0AAW1SZS5_9CHLO